MTAPTRAAHEEDLMRRALELAREGWGQTAPNPMVGAVVVRDGQIVGEGYHARFGEAHAEVEALRAAGERARGATLYVTLEPCRHHGKTPPCTDAILAAGIPRVVMAVADPTSDAGGGGALLRERGIMVENGVLEAEARELNAPFFHAAASDLPFTTLKLAVSIETAIAHARGTASWLTGPESRREVHRLRSGHDAVGVGVGTVLADDPQLTVRDVPPPRVAPTRVVFDRSLRTPPGSVVVRTAREVPTILVTAYATTAPAAEMAAAKMRAAEMRAVGVQVLAAADLRDGFRQLRAAGIRSLLLEGGATIATAALAEELVHRLVIFQAPVAFGRDALPAFDGALPRVIQALERNPVLDRRTLGPDVMTTYLLAGS